MTRTKNRNQPRHKEPVLTIKHIDGTLTEVVPAKSWNPGEFFTAHVDNSASPETFRALAESAQAALEGFSKGEK